MGSRQKRRQVHSETLAPVAAGGHRVLLLALVAARTAGGSRTAYYKQQVSWGYVFDIGNAEEITRWTLEQTEAERVADGVATLANLVVLESGREAKRAVEGYLRVHRKLLEGWPGLKPVRLITGTMR